MGSRRQRVVIISRWLALRTALRNLLHHHADFEVVAVAMDWRSEALVTWLPSCDWVLADGLPLERELQERLQLAQRPHRLGVIGLLDRDGGSDARPWHNSTIPKVSVIGTITLPNHGAELTAKTSDALLAELRALVLPRTPAGASAFDGAPANLSSERPAVLGPITEDAGTRLVGNRSAVSRLMSGLNQRIKLIALGASTGGTEALKDVLSVLPADLPPIVIVQHMPEQFTPALARRLDQVCAMRVEEVRHGQVAQSGVAYLAPGHSHLSVHAMGEQLICQLDQSESVNRHRPSVDVLFHSVAKACPGRALALLLTGMGKDGAQGLMAIRRSGSLTLGQDEASCVVYGMPREAQQIGAVVEELPLSEMGPRVLSALGRRSVSAVAPPR